MQGEPVAVGVGESVAVQATDRSAQAPLVQAAAGLVIQTLAQPRAVLQAPQFLGAGAIQEFLPGPCRQRGKPALQQPPVNHRVTLGR